MKPQKMEMNNRTMEHGKKDFEFLNEEDQQQSIQKFNQYLDKK